MIMGQGRSRITVGRGIYKDRYGFEARVRVGGWPSCTRFPPGTPLKEIREWQNRERVRLRHSGVRLAPGRGTLASDIDTYLSRVKHLKAWISLRAELRHWAKLYGRKRRRALTAGDVMQARNIWLAQGAAPKTVNLRVNALRAMWHTLDGRRAPCPMDEIAPLPVHKTPIRVIQPETVLQVYRTFLEWERSGRLRDAKTRARFMVYMSTGRRPSEIMRAEVGDVDLERRVWNVRDGKGGWSPGIYLNDDMLAAWQVFIAAEAWGTFREGSLVERMRNAGWPKGVRPYHARHTVGITMSEAGIDLADVQPHLGHTRIDTTRRVYVPVLGSRMQKASEAIDHRFGWRVADNVGVPTEPTSS